MQGRIHSTESFGTMDGPGIRFVVFLQGCPMRCLYCHNPDTWTYEGGTLRDSEDILKEYDSYKEFLKGGGITCTGGEPMMQMDFLIELFTKAKERDIHTCLDTSGITFYKGNTEKVDRLLEVTDLVMLDIKHIDRDGHIKLTGHPNDNVLDFARYLDQKKIPFWVRHVIVPGMTDKEEYLIRLGEFLGELSSLKALDVLPYHTMGVSKYESLGIEYPLNGVESADKVETKKARDIILAARKRIISNR